MATIFINKLPPEYQTLAKNIDNNEGLHKSHNVNQYTTPAVKGDGMLSCWEYNMFAQLLPKEVRKFNPYDTNPQARAQIIISNAIMEKQAENLLGKVLAYFKN